MAALPRNSVCFGIGTLERVTGFESATLSLGYFMTRYASPPETYLGLRLNNRQKRGLLRGY